MQSLKSSKILTDALSTIRTPTMSWVDTYKEFPLSRMQSYVLVEMFDFTVVHILRSKLLKLVEAVADQLVNIHADYMRKHLPETVVNALSAYGTVVDMDQPSSINNPFLQGWSHYKNPLVSFETEWDNCMARYRKQLSDACQASKGLPDESALLETAIFGRNGIHETVYQSCVKSYVTRMYNEATLLLSCVNPFVVSIDYVPHHMYKCAGDCQHMFTYKDGTRIRDAYDLENYILSPYEMETVRANFCADCTSYFKPNTAYNVYKVLDRINANKAQPLTPLKTSLFKTRLLSGV